MNPATLGKGGKEQDLVKALPTEGEAGLGCQLCLVLVAACACCQLCLSVCPWCSCLDSWGTSITSAVCSAALACLQFLNVAHITWKTRSLRAPGFRMPAVEYALDRNTLKTRISECFSFNSALHFPTSATSSSGNLWLRTSVLTSQHLCCTSHHKTSSELCRAAAYFSGDEQWD